jgi:hypothetical protein
MLVAEKIKLAGVLIIVGLIIEAVSLIWFRPLTFLAFIIVGGLAIASGMLCYLFTMREVE